MTKLTERELFAAAIELPDPAGRQAYLSAACAADGELQRRIELLVLAHQSDDDFMVCPAASLERSEISAASAVTLTLEHDSSVSTPRYAMRRGWSERRLAAGTTFGRYRIDSVLGRGGMATVYQATDLRLNRRVAIKTPHFDDESAPELVERFEREARVMALVQHRNLCGIHDIGELDGVHYLSMEFIDGETLAQVLERGEQFSSQRIAQLLRRLAQATRRAHQAGVVHRDLKPANVMIDREGEPVIMDFGLAHTPDDDARLTNAGFIMGTPAYMSPEQALGEPHKVGSWSDIYSLGAILYELLTGRPVYAGSTTRVLGQLVAEKPIAAPSSIRPEVDPALEAICLRALARMPEDRFESAEDLAVALDGYLSAVRVGTPHATKEPVHADSRRQPARRSQVWIAVASLLGVVGLALVYGIHLGHGKFVLTTDGPATATADREAPRVAPRKEQHPLVSPDYAWSEPVNLGAGVNSAANEENASVSADGLTLLFNRREAGRQMLWESRRARVDEPFGPALRLGDELNLAGFDHETPFLSPDGLTLWYASNRPSSAGPRDLWVSRRSAADAPWGTPDNLGLGVNTPGFEQTPFVTADGLTLLFSRALRLGEFELCLASRQSPAEAFETRQVLTHLNGGDTSSFPQLNADGLAMVFVFSPAGSRKLELMATVRDSINDEFQSPQKLSDIGVHDSIAGLSLSADGQTLYYTATHPEQPENQNDLWSVTRVRKPRATACSQAVKRGRVASRNKAVSRSTPSVPFDDPRLLAEQHCFSEDSEAVALGAVWTAIEATANEVEDEHQRRNSPAIDSRFQWPSGNGGVIPFWQVLVEFDGHGAT